MLFWALGKNTQGLLNLSDPASTPKKVREKSSVPIFEKMILTIAEASALSGRPQSELRKAFLQGKLHGVKLGRGIKVRKEDLKMYIDNLFVAPPEKIGEM
jgi:excisionase family DNA binding protein